MSSADKSLNGSIKKVTVLKSKPNHEQAMNMLMRCVKITINVMKKRNWVVSSMNEFVPKENNLLGLNINRTKIMIRLRPPDNENSFYPFEHVLGTVLHELVHMSISPHNAAFDALLETLWTEVESEDGGRLLLNSLGGNMFTFASAGAAGAADNFVPFSEKGHKLGGAKQKQGVKRRKVNAAGAVVPVLSSGSNGTDVGSLKDRVAAAALNRLLGSSSGGSGGSRGGSFASDGGGRILGGTLPLTALPTASSSSSSSSSTTTAAASSLSERVRRAAAGRASINSKSRDSCGNSIRLVNSSNARNSSSNTTSSSSSSPSSSAGSVGSGFVDLSSVYDLTLEDEMSDPSVRVVTAVDEDQLERDYQRDLQFALEASLLPQEQMMCSNGSNSSSGSSSSGSSSSGSNSSGSGSGSGGSSSGGNDDRMPSALTLTVPPVPLPVPGTAALVDNDGDDDSGEQFHGSLCQQITHYENTECSRVGINNNNNNKKTFNRPVLNCTCCRPGRSFRDKGKDESKGRRAEVATAQTASIATTAIIIDKPQQQHHHQQQQQSEVPEVIMLLDSSSSSSDDDDDGEDNVLSSSTKVIKAGTSIPTTTTVPIVVELVLDDDDDDINGNEYCKK